VPSARSLHRSLAVLAGAAALLAAQGTASAARQSPAASARAPANPRLLPDITTLRINSADLEVDTSRDRTLLRLSNRIANRGRGPLEIYPSARSHDCNGNGDPADDRDAIQRIFLDANGDGVFRRGTDTQAQRHRFGCERYDPAARHWNIFDLARYELRRLHSGKTIAKKRKVAFCTIDTERVFPRLPGSPRSRYYPRGDCDQHTTLGISIGWADEYYYGLPAQRLDVTGVKAGRYCLVSIGDPDNLLRESNNSNNARRTRIELQPGKLKVRTLPGRCRLSG
jgi:hypothetical protein